MRKALLISAAALSFAAAAPAEAATVIVDGISYSEGQVIPTFNFNGVSDGGVVTGLNSTLSLTFADVNASGDYVFNFTVANTSQSPHTLSRVTGFGFDTNPDPDIAASSESSAMFDLVTSGSIANSFNVDFCLTTGATCNGGQGNVGVLPNQSASGSFIVAFTGGDPGTVTLSDFHTRYQSTSTGQVGNTSGSATGVVIPPIPEPATWGMMLIGFGAIGAAMRRRRRQVRFSFRGQHPA